MFSVSAPEDLAVCLFHFGFRISAAVYFSVFYFSSSREEELLHAFSKDLITFYLW